MRVFGRRGALARAVAALFLCAAVLVAVPVGAHYIDLTGKLVEKDVLTFGVALVGKPYAYREDGTLKGFDIDWAGEVAHSRGLTLRVVQIARARLAEALAAGEVDMINSFALKGDRPPDIALVPYLVIGDHLMVLKGNPFRIKAVEDLAGHTVSSTSGSTAEAFAWDINERLVAEGHAPMHVHSFPYQRDTHFPVSMGHAAGYFIKSVSALAPGLDPDSRVRVLEGIFQPRREVGFALRAGADDLKDALEHAVAAKIANGTYDRLRAAHGIPDDLSPFR